MKRLRASAVAAGVLVVWCFAMPLAAPAHAQAPAAAEEETVRTELRTYYADFSARDWKKFASHFWPGATLTTIWRPPGEPAARVVAVTVPEFLAKTAEGPDSKPIFEEVMTGVEVKLHGNLAQAWANYDAKFGQSGNVAQWSGIDAFTLMKHDGRWKITSLAYTSAQADAAVARGRVTGIGGVFIYANDAAALAGWYSKHFGLEFTVMGSTHYLIFRSRGWENTSREEATVFSIFAAKEPLDKTRLQFRVNYRVDNLDRLLARLRAEGVAIERVEDTDHGRFAWLTDPEANRIELWEPPEKFPN